MKIKNVKSKHFAGISNLNQSFEDGMNVIYGENESGKSTVADLIYRLLFTSSKFHKTQGPDADFVDLYFPKTTGEYQTDTVDGAITFETENGVYELMKEWTLSGNRNPDLIIPGGRLTDTDTVNEVLNEELQYGRGIYNELVFASQKRNPIILEAIFDPTFKSKSLNIKEELTYVVAKAVMESGGVELSKLKTELDKEIKKYETNWNSVSNKPKKKQSVAKPDETKTNAILFNAYNAKEDVRKQLKDAEELEKTIDDAVKELEGLKSEKKKLENQKKVFENNRYLIENFDRAKISLQKATEESAKLETIQKRWPQAEEKLAKARKLNEQRNQAVATNRYNQIKGIKDKIAALEEKNKDICAFTDEEVRTARIADRKINDLEAKLSAVDLKAKIRKLGNEEIEVYALATGEKLDVEDDTVLIKEAAKIVIPNVAEMEFTPANLDTEAVLGELKKNKEILTEILSRHNASSFEELEEAAKEYDRDQNTLKCLSDKEELLQKGESFENLEKKVSSFKEPARDVSTLNEEIEDLCGAESLDAVIGSESNKIQSYKEDYGSKEGLAEKLRNTKAEIREYGEQLNQFEEIPEELKTIKDRDAYYEDLGNKIDSCIERISVKNREISIAESKLDGRSVDELEEELKDKEKRFNSKFEDYQHWKHIQEVFEIVKNSGSNAAIEDINDKFQKYLSLISDDGIELTSIDKNMNATMVSGNSELTYNILSEGTKDTVYLAFRLAMLEHLFPDGSGLAIFDDPFTDMDEKRRKNSADLIKAFAKNNQVILMTCDTSVRDLFEDANVIEMTRS